MLDQNNPGQKQPAPSDRTRRSDRTGRQSCIP